MVKRALCLLCGMLACAASPAPAQSPGPAPVEIGPAGEAYLKALRLRRIDTDVRYFDPTRPAPDLDTDVAPPKPEPGDQGDRPQANLRVVFVAALILGGVVVLFLRFGGGLSVSFGRAGDNAHRGGRRGAETAPGAPPPSSLAAILAIADRRAALVTLAGAALTRAVEAQGLLFQKSWTGRDVLRHLPPATAFRDDLQALVLASERVHFGGRDVSEDEFRSHVARIRPLLEGGR